MRISRTVALTILPMISATIIACQGSAVDPGASIPIERKEAVFVEVPAPIKSIVVDFDESSPSQYFLGIQTELASRCIKQGNYEVKRDANIVTVDVTVLVPTEDSLTTCIDDYLVVEKTVALGSDFDHGTTYTVIVNGETTSFTIEDSPVQGTEPIEAPAPIDALTINVAELPTPQYMLLITSGLPNGCAEFGTSTVTRDGDNISILVTNYLPADQNMACDTAYSTVETTVALGSDFEPGTTYTVLVNDKSSIFIAQDEVTQKIEEDAPVESVTIDYVPDGGSRLVLTTGLPSGCHEIIEPLILRSNDTIIVEVQNMVPIDALCTKDYRVVESRLSVPDALVACATYDVNVNGVVYVAQAIGSNILCSEPDLIDTAVSDHEVKIVEIDAPINSVAVNVTESLPPQYFAAVISELPSDCAKLGGYSVEHHGATIRVTVTNLVTADEEIVCTAIYSTIETNIPLGSAFNPDTTYTVVVNDREKATFTTDGSALGEQSKSIEVKIDIGDTVDGGSDDLRIGFLDVTEDSRCPANAVCAWKGRVKVLLGVVVGKEMPAFLEVEFGDEVEGDSTMRAGEYAIEIIALDPYPGTVTLPEGERPAYVLTVLVSKG